MVVQTWWIRFRRCVAGVTNAIVTWNKYLLSLVLSRITRFKKISFALNSKTIYYRRSPFNVAEDCISEVSTMGERKNELKEFLQFLDDRCGFVFDVDRFDHRIMLQKYVFIAKFLGWDHDYNYNLYIRGPYSPDLAKAYYNLDEISSACDRSAYSLDEERFASIIKGKRVSWLEVGTTMLSLYSNCRYTIDRDKISPFLLERTRTIKSDYDKGDFIERVLHDLIEYGMVISN